MQPTALSRFRLFNVLAAADDATSPDALAAVQQLDALIDTLMSKKNPQDLAQTVAENIMSFDQRFWLRLATRSDAASDEEQKQQLAALAKVVMQLVDSVVRRTNEQLTESTSLLQDILKAAADPQTGEWQLPLGPDKLEAMRGVMVANPAAMDEGLLAACYSWMRKASEDKLDGMVALLQKVLQIYACQQLGTPQAGGDKQRGGGDAAVDELLAADEALWTRLIRQRADEGSISEPAFMEALQRRMESVVLGLPSGSYAQRVQAEYLKELEERAKGAFADLAAEGKTA
ncbi:hypothetical protein CHLNCDRAFT_138166 [Chlorella variabilis]|uniref:Uncharacterized protein n=1 Tax=Chlorella variabilis TaxID=554065 RepID=E1Z3Q0_CHLVA|nr:hypothetical protein CHLNCDRAFT_138166 [Chlorella variabilis]EFN59214.1 hypothetical protein CHLNCDRAFT_138166 [Chlorella variabilis]|eukprot:XP_005851316.1 hypothetical protein CHLNCDRAFT_138166 [Chlorella variabilis]